MAQTGTEKIFAVGGTKLQFEMYKERELKRVQDELTAQGKEIVNIIESEITRPLGGWSQDMRIIWKTAEVKTTHTVTVPQTKPTIEKVSVTSDNFNSILERIDLFLEDKNWEKAIAYCESALDFDPKNASVYLKYLLADCKCSTFEELLDSNNAFEKNSYYQKVLRFGDEEFTSSLKETILRNKEQKEIIRCNNIYDQAKSLISNTNQTEESYDSICKLLKSIPGYKDADELLEIHTIKAEEHKKENTYNEAIKKINSEDINELNNAINLFKQIPDWKDSQEQILICQQKIEEIKIQQEQKRIEKQREKEKKKKKLITIIIAIISFLLACIIAFFVIRDVAIPLSIYNNGVELLTNKQYTEAINTLTQVYETKDAQEKITQAEKELLKQAKVGDIVLFGNCSQTESFGAKTPIEWIVLEHDNNKLLLISKYCLGTCEHYSDVYEIKPKLSALINEYFSSEEQQLLKATKSPNFEEEKIFILNEEEIIKYFPDEASRKLVPTTYIYNMYTDHYYGTNDLNYCFGGKYIPWHTVTLDGYGMTMDDIWVNHWADFEDVGLRPVIWVSIESE